MPSSAIGTVRLGSDVLLGSRRLHGSRVGVVCNHASVDLGFRHIIDRLRETPGVHLAAIFGPQHGFRSDVQDNMVETPHGDDATRRVPVYSLYSETREPTAEMLRDLDVLVIDLQDIGARIYTYIYTMANCLRASARHGVPVIVCDRPNPIGGVQVEGASLSRGFESFVGQFPIPMRHGMTIGELAQLFNAERKIGADLTVVKMDGWRRDQWFDQTGLTWINPSPNMRNLNQATLYPGVCLLEPTNVSVGRGTNTPFEVIGAPWLDAKRLAVQKRERDQKRGGCTSGVEHRIDIGEPEEEPPPRRGRRSRHAAFAGRNPRAQADARRGVGDSACHARADAEAARGGQSLPRIRTRLRVVTRTRAPVGPEGTATARRSIRRTPAGR